MSRYLTKKNLTIFIGIAVAILIAISTTSYALPTLADSISIDYPLLKPIIETSFIELVTKIYLP